MCFGGLICADIVLRGGSRGDAYTNLYSPSTPLEGLENTVGVKITDGGPNHEQVRELYRNAANAGRGATDLLSREFCEELIEKGEALTGGMSSDKAHKLKASFE